MAALAEFHVAASSVPGCLPRNDKSPGIASRLDQLRSLPIAPLHLPLPTDSRLRKITERLRRNPGEQRTLSQWAALAHVSERTLGRLFRQELSMSFGEWRQQARLLASLERLALGESVTNIALDLGYEGPSAFIHMFRCALGTSPGRYFRSAGDDSPLVPRTR